MIIILAAGNARLPYKTALPELKSMGKGSFLLNDTVGAGT